MNGEETLFHAKAAPNLLTYTLFRISVVIAPLLWLAVFAVTLFPEAAGPDISTPTGMAALVAFAALFSFPLYHYLFRRKKILITSSQLKLGEDNIHWSLIEEIRIKKIAFGAPRNADTVIVKTKDMAERKFHLFHWDINRFQQVLENLRTQNPAANFTVTVERPHGQRDSPLHSKP